MAIFGSDLPEYVSDPQYREALRPLQRYVLVPSDQGTQYGSDDWLRFCRDHDLEPRMSRRGNCWDNAVVESFFSSLKKERIKKRIHKPREPARADVFDYSGVFCNRKRRHSHLGGVSPEAIEQVSI
jgi:putative transposase